MLRNLAVLMSALVATSAQAQDASTPDAGTPTPAAPPAGDKQRPPALASREPVQSRDGLLPPNSPPARPDAGFDTTTLEALGDCGMTLSFFNDGPPPIALQAYSWPTSETSPEQDGQHQAVKAPPWIMKAGRCGQRYVIQLKSESNEDAAKDAKIVGADGDVLKVILVGSRVDPTNTRIDVILVEKTKGVAVPNYRLATFQLIAEDGRVIEVQTVLLP